MNLEDISSLTHDLDHFEDRLHFEDLALQTHVDRIYSWAGSRKLGTSSEVEMQQFANAVEARTRSWIAALPLSEELIIDFDPVAVSLAPQPGLESFETHLPEDVQLMPPPDILNEYLHASTPSPHDRIMDWLADVPLDGRNISSPLSADVYIKPEAAEYPPMRDTTSPPKITTIFGPFTTGAARQRRRSM